MENALENAFQPLLRPLNNVKNMKQPHVVVVVVVVHLCDMGFFD